MQLIRARALVLGVDHVPGRLRRVAVEEHEVLGPGVVGPPLAGLEVHFAQPPPSERVVDPAPEPALLLGVAHRRPVLDQDDPVLDEQALEDRAPGQEAVVLARGAEAHHPLDPGPVVPAAVEQDELAGGGQLADVALEVPLGALSLGRHRQGHDAADPGAQ